MGKKYVFKPKQIIIKPEEITKNETTLKILENNKKEPIDNDNDDWCYWGWAYDRPYDY